MSSCSSYITILGALLNPRSAVTQAMTTQEPYNFWAPHRQLRQDYALPVHPVRHHPHYSPCGPVAEQQRGQVKKISRTYLSASSGSSRRVPSAPPPPGDEGTGLRSPPVPTPAALPGLLLGAGCGSCSSSLPLPASSSARSLSRPCPKEAQPARAVPSPARGRAASPRGAARGLPSASTPRATSTSSASFMQNTAASPGSAAARGRLPRRRPALGGAPAAAPFSSPPAAPIQAGSSRRRPAPAAIL